MSSMTKQHAYITTAIPYVNGLPHIGHAMDYMLADVWARYQRQNGREVRFQTGVDEHGNKIAAKLPVKTKHRRPMLTKCTAISRT